jgi:putative DNA primase/helicase
MQRKQEIGEYFNGNYLPFYKHHLSDLKRNGKEYKAVCPFHDDTDPSLSINPETGQFHCFGCKAGGDIFTFYAKLNELSLNGDFPRVCQGIANDFNIPVNAKQKRTNKKKTTSKQSKIVQTYDYRDETFGKLLYQKIRTEPKGFYIRRPSINGAWKNGLGKVKPVLYRLKQVTEADEVCITEGEKDADNLVKLGFAATTNFDGAGKWRDEYNEPLAGKSINIFPDYDQQGIKHAQLVASKVHPVAKSVKIIELPDLEEGEDVSDFIAQFDDPETAAERVSILIENTPEYEPPRIYTIEDAILTADKFAEIETPEHRYYLKPWCKEDSIILIPGTRGAGKTFMGQGIVDAVSSGSSFGPWPCEHSVPCLYLDGEMTVSDNKERIKLLGLNTIRENPIYYYSDAYANRLGLPKARLDDEEWRSTMKDLLLILGVKLWVVDNIASLAPGLDENVKADWDEINQWLLELRFSGICTILLHHTGKSGKQRGTSAREDNIDVSIMLNQPPDYESPDGARFILHFSKQRIQNKYLHLIGDTEFKLIEDQTGQYVWTYKDVRQERKQEVLKMIAGGYSQKSIAELTGLSKGYISKIKKKAIDEGYLNKNGKLSIEGKAHISGLSDAPK